MSNVLERNINTVFDHSKRNTMLINDLENKVAVLEAEILWSKAQMDDMRRQIQALQVKLFSGGATSGNIH
jgi:capsule polysaccharide export protein KpsE/RkpR